MAKSIKCVKQKNKNFYRAQLISSFYSNTALGYFFVAFSVFTCVLKVNKKEHFGS